MTTGRSTAWAAGLLLALGVLLYLPTRRLGYVGDDVTGVALNGCLAERLFDALHCSREVTLSTFWLERRLFGLHPFLSRLVNLALHLLASLALSSLALSRSPNRALATGLGAVFFLHAINSQAVVMTIQRATVLATLFSLLSLRHALAGRGGRAGVLFLLALFSKQTAAVFALPLLWLQWRGRRPGREGALDAFYLAATASAVLVPAAVFLVLVLPGGAGGLDPRAPLAYAATQAAHAPFYLGKILAPLDLHFLYALRPVDPWSDASWAAPAAGVAAAGAGAAALAARFRRGSLPLLGLAALAWVPEFTLFPIPHVFFEHRLYMPLAFLLAFAGSLSRSRGLGPRGLAALAAALLLLSAATLHRTAGIRDDVMWEDEVLAHPANDRHFHYEIILERLLRGDAALAREGLGTARANAPPGDRNLDLLAALVRDAGDGGGRGGAGALTEAGRLLRTEPRLGVQLRIRANLRVLARLPDHVPEDRRRLLAATLVCPQTRFLPLDPANHHFQAEMELVEVCAVSALHAVKGGAADAPERAALRRILSELEERGVLSTRGLSF